jgi:polyferredoxin
MKQQTGTLYNRRLQWAAALWWILPIVAIGGWFIPQLGWWVPVCMLAPITIAAFHGRKWCGWYCPRGAFFDYILGSMPKRHTPPAWMRGRAFRTGVLILLMGLMTAQLTIAWPDPLAMARVFVLLLGVTTLVGIGLAWVFGARAWCTVCPAGTLAHWVARDRRPLRVVENCRDCRACEKVCAMRLSPHRDSDAVKRDCVKCARCIDRCPVNALAFEEAAA